MACELGLAVLRQGSVTVPRLLRAFRSGREALREDHRGGDALARRQYSMIADQLHCAPEHVERVVAEWMYRRPLKWLPLCRRRGLLPLLDTLDAQGVRAGIFSDYPAHDKLAALGLAGRFDPILSAVDSAIDAFKPSPRGYLAAAAAWNLPPEDILYVGDRADVDAAGARAAGMACAILGTGAGSSSPDILYIRDFAELQRVVTQPR